mmetsp:Transcript_484/g.971  ORF Transcript_484/g.971 Transcript_484/m.971 type:complete len:628 (+) Transcript_484:31-1914(+)
MDGAPGTTDGAHSPTPQQETAAPTPSRGRGRKSADAKGGPRRGQKRAASAAASKDDKKRRTTRASRQPVPPPSIDIATTHEALGNCDVDTVASRLTSEDPAEVSWALNGLLKASADVEANYCLGVGGEVVIQALCELFDDAIGWDDEGAEDDEYDNLQPSPASWCESSLTGIWKTWRTFCREKLASPLSPSSDPKLWIDPDTDARILEMIVAILRNLSYVAQNLRFMAHSDDCLRILVGALSYRGYSVGGAGIEGHERSGEDVPLSSHHSNMCVHSIQTLTNIAPLIDITGRQLFIDRVLVESDSIEVRSSIPHQQRDKLDTSKGADANELVSSKYPTYGMASHLGFGGMHLAKQYDGKAETIDSIPDSVVWGMVGSNVRATLALFPALLTVLDPNDTTTVTTSASGWHRPSVQSLLELLTALIENPDNKGIFLCVPDALLHRLTGMLFIPRLGPDSMDYVDPVGNVVSRVVALKLMMGYDATVDSDLRDRACELLVKLTDLSPSIKRRLGRAPAISGMAHRNYDVSKSDSTLRKDGQLSPSILKSDESSSSRRINIRLYDSLLSMISAGSGRGDSGTLASQLLANLAAVPENKAGILYVERKLISLCGKDPHIANAACNGIFNRLK